MKVDESKLTAYAIDELPAEERGAFEAQLTNDAAARDEIDAIREAAKSLEVAFKTESVPVARRRVRFLTMPRLAAAAAVALGIGGIFAATKLLKREHVYVATSISTTAPTDAARANSSREVQPAVTASPAKAPVAEPAQRNVLLNSDARPTAAHAPAADKTLLPQLNGPVNGTTGLESVTAVAASPTIQPPLAAATVTDGMDSALAPTASRAAPNSSGQTDYYKSSNGGSTHYFADASERQKGWGQVLSGERPAEGTKFNTEAYDRITDNAFLEVAGNPLSTFSIDVDTAAYSNMRRFITQGQLPPPDAVRIEELINYFPYDYKYPANTDGPFAASVEVAACPWNPSHRLARVGLKAKDIATTERPATNLVFLLDVSGSMNQPNKLPLVKSSMRMLVEKLGENDHVTIVTYAGTSGLVLPPTSGMNKKQILSAIQELKPGGSTNGAGGITLAYEQAESGFIKGGANRVILATDGDFNVGVTDQGQLTRLIEQKAKTGVFLSVLGFGMGNLKDSTMEKLADKGNGNYAYIDTPNEGRKVLVEQMTGTLVTVAKDVKIQVEFNPAVAASYRLIGYENRMLAKEDFNDDKKDAGEIGAGHTVTALYEIVPAGSKDVATAKVDDLKYQKSPPETEPVAPPASAELLTLKLRYKEPEGETSKLMEFPITDGGSTFDKASGDFKFTTAVAGFGMLLRNSPHKGDASFSSVLEWAEEGMGADASGYRQEFIDLVRKAKELKSDHPQINTDEHR